MLMHRQRFAMNGRCHRVVSYETVSSIRSSQVRSNQVVAFFSVLVSSLIVTGGVAVLVPSCVVLVYRGTLHSHHKTEVEPELRRGGVQCKARPNDPHFEVVVVVLLRLVRPAARIKSPRVDASDSDSCRSLGCYAGSCKVSRYRTAKTRS